MRSPDRLGHVVLKTFDVERMRDWYCDVLGARVVFESLPAVSLITYDDEHHRLAFTKLPGEPTVANAITPGMHHLAFFFDSIRDLLSNYRELKKRQIEPVFPVHHGPVVALYYTDPDGNSVEFGVDRFASPAEAQAFIDANFARNPVGISIDPDQLVEMMDAGASEEELMAFDTEAPMAQLPYEELKESF